MSKAELVRVGELHEKMYGTRPAPNTISRWMNVGRRVRGETRTLKVARVRGCIYTTPEWLSAFVEDHAEAQQQIDRGPTTKQLQRAQQAAESFLAAEGV